MLVQTLMLPCNNRIINPICPTHETANARPSLDMPRFCLLTVLTLCGSVSVYVKADQSDECNGYTEEEEVVVE
jgi:hypothetical protein